jgi:hypothetical protein
LLLFFPPTYFSQHYCEGSSLCVPLPAGPSPARSKNGLGGLGPTGNRTYMESDLARKHAIPKWLLNINKCNKFASDMELLVSLSALPSYLLSFSKGWRSSFIYHL